MTVFAELWPFAFVIQGSSDLSPVIFEVGTN